MNIDTLSSIVKRLKSFTPVIDNICELHDTDELAAVKLLVHNVARDFTDCGNYTHDDAIKYLKSTLKTLKSMIEYNGERNPLLSYIIGEVDMTIAGNILTEKYENLDVCSCGRKVVDSYDCICGGS